MSNIPVVIDNGTGYTKLGYAGNVEPAYVFPSCIAEPPPRSVKPEQLGDLDFYIGQEALDATAKYPEKYFTSYALKHGCIDNWDQMEKMWQQCLYKYMRCEPESHPVVLTEPPMNPPENREYAAEIMFETFGVPALNISAQAVLALGSVDAVTGTVIDSGDGVTHIIPVYEKVVITSGIKHIPLAGRDITEFMYKLIKERETTHPDVNMKQEVRKIKEEYGYVCKDLAREFQRYDADRSKYVKKWSGVVPPKGEQTWEIDVGPEQFLGPEIFFHPEMFGLDHTVPLPQLVDEVIRGCPIDTRIPLYKNILLSGGTTLFKNFRKRLRDDVKSIVDGRMALDFERRGGRGTVKDIEVTVEKPHNPQHAVWIGGSMLGSQEDFMDYCATKAMYEENGPSVCRGNVMGSGIFK